MGWALAVKVTEPVGMVLAAATCAVSVMDWKASAGLGVALSSVELEARTLGSTCS